MDSLGKVLRYLNRIIVFGHSCQWAEFDVHYVYFQEVQVWTGKAVQLERAFQGSTAILICFIVRDGSLHQKGFWYQGNILFFCFF